MGKSLLCRFKWGREDDFEKSPRWTEVCEVQVRPLDRGEWHTVCLCCFYTCCQTAAAMWFNCFDSTSSHLLSESWEFLSKLKYIKVKFHRNNLVFVITYLLACCKPVRLYLYDFLSQKMMLGRMNASVTIHFYWIFSSCIQNEWWLSLTYPSVLHSRKMRGWNNK